MTKLATFVRDLNEWLIRNDYDPEMSILTPGIIKKAIYELHGMDARTVSKWLKILKETGMISEDALAGGWRFHLANTIRPKLEQK